MSAHHTIHSLLQAFQDGYTRRDLAQVDSFMELFTTDAEVIGTNGLEPGQGEWYTSRAAARELVHGDWEGWGDLRLDLSTSQMFGFWRNIPCQPSTGLSQTPHLVAESTYSTSARRVS
jgi:hypothetical protein